MTARRIQENFMRKFIAATAAVLSLVAVSAFARDPIRDGRLQITPAKNDRFEAAEYTLGKAELYGYVSDLKDTKKITGILLLRGDKSTDMQKHLIAITAKAQQIDALIDLDGKVQPLVDPTPTPDAPPPALDNTAPAQAPAQPATATPEH
jgi:hypothetical protein